MVEVLRLPPRPGIARRPKRNTDMRLPLSNVLERVGSLRKMARSLKAVEDKMDLERAAGRLEDDLRRRGVDPTQ